MSHMASSSAGKADTAFPNMTTAVPVLTDSSIRGVEDGVSPAINAFRSPYPPSPTYFVTVVPPDDFLSSELSQVEHDRHQRGSLLPLYPSLGGQLWAISREFALPSLGGLMLYLTDDGQGNRGPRIGDGAWQALWSRYFNEDDVPATSAQKPTAFAPSRRSSTIAGDSFADPSSSAHSHAADLSRSTLGESSSSRPSIPYVSSRPSPRVDALPFPRRDTSAEWSPSVRSAHWVGNTSSSSASRVTPSVAPFPHIPILARLEWQVDVNKAPWWPAWIASRSSARERPQHKVRKSMHLASDPPKREMDKLVADEDEKVADCQQASTRDAEPQLSQETTNHKTDFAEAGPSASRSVTPSKDRSNLAESLAPSASSRMLPSSVAEDERPESAALRSPPSPPQSQYSDEDAQDDVVRHNDSVEEQVMDVQDELVSGRHSPSDEPLRSARASILSMSSDGSQRAPSPSVVSAGSASEDIDAVVAPTTPLASDPRSTSPKLHLDDSSAELSHHGSSEQSRTGYSELLEANGAEDQETDRDGEYSLEELPPQHDGAYAALPDSPASEKSAPIDDRAASNHEQEPFSQEGFQLRHSFILDAGDEGMWRDLQLQDVDQLFPEPREQTRTIPSGSRHSKDCHLIQETQPHEPSVNFEDLKRSNHVDVPAAQPQDEQHQWTLDGPAQSRQGIHEFQSFLQANDFAHDAYYSPQRSNAARIQSWIGKTPTGRPESAGAFDVESGLSVDEDGLLLPNDSDIDEVVGLWTSKILQDPHSVPHISAPANTNDAEQTAADEILKQDEQTETLPESVVVQHESENKSLGTTPAPTVSLLSPIHLDAAAFDGVKPDLGSLTVPQLLSPTAVGDAFDTPRPPSTQRSASTPLVQQHAPSSPSSLAPPQDRRPSCASRRSSGDLSDTLEDMEKALQLLSPSVSPNPGLGLSPDPSGRKMSSRDSLAYARSISASVTPSPKWIARAKAATAKSRNARSSFAVGGSPFERGHVSPRPASTSAVSSSRSRSPGFQAPISASRLMEFAQEESVQRKARTEVGDADSVRMEDSQDKDVSKAVPVVTEVPAATVQVMPDVLPSSASARSIAGEEELLDTVDTTSKEQGFDEHQSVDEEAVNKEAVNDEAAEARALLYGTAEQEGGSRDSTSFTSAEQEDEIASIQRFLHGRVTSSLKAGTTASHDLSDQANGLEQESSADGTIIERSASLESGLQSVTSEPRFFDAQATVTAVPESIGTSDHQPHAPATKEEKISNERWSQSSFATGNFSSHPSGDSLHSSGPRHGLQAHTPIFTYDAHLSSEPTTVDTQLSSATADSEGLSVAGQLVKSYMSTSPSDDAFFRSPGPMDRPLAGTHDDTLDEDEIRTMNEDTRAAVREALSESTAHHVNILPGVVPTSSSNKSSISPTASPLSSHSSLGDHLRRRGSASSLNQTSMSGGAGSNASSPNLNSGGSKSPRRKPSRLNLNIDGLARSPPSTAATAAAARMSSTSPRMRFAQLPPSPSLHPSYKAAMSSPLSQSFPVMADTGSPQGKTFLPSFTSLKGGLAG